MMIILQYLRVDNEGKASARGHHRPHLLVCEVRHEAQDGEDDGGGEQAGDGVGDGDQDSVAVAVAVKPAPEQLEGDQECSYPGAPVVRGHGDDAAASWAQGEDNLTMSRVHRLLLLSPHLCGGVHPEADVAQPAPVGAG